MHEEHMIIEEVYLAKEDSAAADAFIRAYISFIKSETAKLLNRPCSETDDEYSIALIAFYEAINGYMKERGSFLNYAALLIRNRLIDHYRKEMRHNMNLSLDEPDTHDETTMADELVEQSDPIGEAVSLEASQQEIFELTETLKDFGISLTDVADNCPKQERTLNACRQVVRFAINNPELLNELLRTKKLPMAKLSAGVSVERKTLERHRKYIMALLLIQTNGYEIIRGHLRPMLAMNGGACLMKYLIMECHPSYVVALDEMGRFIKAKNLNYQPGQTVTKISALPTRKTLAFPTRTWLAAITASAAVLVFALLALFMNMSKSPAVFASVFLTINPEVRIDVDQNEKVIDLVGLNLDGKALLEGYDAKQQTLDPVVDELLDRAIELGFLYDGGIITVSFDAQDEDWKNRAGGQLDKRIHEHMKDKISVTVQISQTLDTEQSAVIPVLPPESETSKSKATSDKNTTAKPYSDDAYGPTKQTTATAAPSFDTDYDDDDGITDYDERDDDDWDDADDDFYDDDDDSYDDDAWDDDDDDDDDTDYDDDDDETDYDD